MIRVTHRVGRNNAVSGGLFALMFYALFIGPLMFGIWAGVVLCWALWQVCRGIVGLVVRLNAHR